MESQDSMSSSTGWVTINREAEFQEGFAEKREEDGDKVEQVCDQEEEVVGKERRLKRVWGWEMGGKREGLERGMARGITVENIVFHIFEFWWEIL